MYVNNMFNQELINLYNALVSNKTDKERFATGGTADLQLLAPGFVAKSDKPGYTFIEREYNFMVQLWEAGFRAMPEPKQDWGVAYTPEATFVMSEIVHGIPLEEVVNKYKEGDLPKFMLRHILDVVEGVWEEFHNYGAVHADPHLKNILVGMDIEGNWRVWLIDFGMSFWEGHDDRLMPTTVDSITKDIIKYEKYLHMSLE